jgi:hypothetical protein
MSDPFSIRGSLTKLPFGTENLLLRECSTSINLGDENTLKILTLSCCHTESLVLPPALAKLYISESSFDVPIVLPASLEKITLRVNQIRFAQDGQYSNLREAIIVDYWTPNLRCFSQLRVLQLETIRSPLSLNDQNIINSLENLETMEITQCNMQKHTKMKLRCLRRLSLIIVSELVTLALETPALEELHINFSSHLEEIRNVSSPLEKVTLENCPNIKVLPTISFTLPVTIDIPRHHWGMFPARLLTRKPEGPHGVLRNKYARTQCEWIEEKFFDVYPSVVRAALLCLAARQKEMRCLPPELWILMLEEFLDCRGWLA